MRTHGQGVQKAVGGLFVRLFKQLFYDAALLGRLFQDLLVVEPDAQLFGQAQPNLAPAAAQVQLPAIAEASGLSPERLAQIVADNTEEKLLGVFGEETVNVLGVNLDIALAMGLISETEK